MSPAGRAIAAALAIAACGWSASPTRVLVLRKGAADTVALAASTDFLAMVGARDTVVALGTPIYVAAMEHVAGLRLKDSTLKALALRNRALNDSLARKVDTFGQVWRKLDSIQDSSYRALSALQRKSDSMLAASIRNTDQAVGIARSIRRSSYLASALVGAAAGLVVRRSVWTGVGGALLGAGLNFLLVDF